MTKLANIAAAAALIAGAMFTGTSVASLVSTVAGIGTTTEPTFPQGSTVTLPPCAEEDSVNCVWDAGTSGNGEGTSFIAIAVPGGAWIVRADGTADFYPTEKES